MDVLSASSSSSSNFVYDIFLSFRGEDTRLDFADHLYTALKNANFRVFRDKNDMKLGFNIKPQLDYGIRQSRIAIVLISEGYRYSKWCLDELVYIIQRRKLDDRYIVFPIFYHVRPSEIRNLQNVNFKKEFEEHNKDLCVSEKKIDEWRKALNEVSGFMGKVLPARSNRRESDFIKEIVKKVRSILHQPDIASWVASKSRDIDLWLKDPKDVRVGVISGMKGVGKFTIAKFVYDSNVADFEASSFLNIREASTQEDGLTLLRNQLIADVSKRREQRVSNIEEGTICPIRFLVVLNDANQSEHIDALITPADWFFTQSKIIITTSREHLVSHWNQNYKTFSIRPLDDNESLQLFSFYAFSQDRPPEGYLEHSKRVIAHCKGCPSSLQNIASLLVGKNINQWVKFLEKREEIREESSDIILEVSYKMLDKHEQQLFLEIAMLMLGQDANDAETALKKCDFYSKVGMQNLKKKSFIKVDNQNKLIMDPSLAAMARRIYNLATADSPGNSSFNSSTETTNESIISGIGRRGKRKRLDDQDELGSGRIDESPRWFKRLWFWR
uniref:disease resistance protein RUN1-like isoform X2 n=1 Tax=Erigeron canadensis TaxID=72917 RepID=UPI001CB9806F|nr:disease resistance protein RUN1-like isoform X2 [Erigeron canadensis]